MRKGCLLFGGHQDALDRSTDALNAWLSSRLYQNRGKDDMGKVEGSVATPVKQKGRQRRRAAHVGTL
jgi:hypothetical protein